MRDEQVARERADSEIRSEFRSEAAAQRLGLQPDEKNRPAS